MKGWMVLAALVAGCEASAPTPYVRSLPSEVFTGYPLAKAELPRPTAAAKDAYRKVTKAWINCVYDTSTRYTIATRESAEAIAVASLNACDRQQTAVILALPSVNGIMSDVDTNRQEMREDIIGLVVQARSRPRVTPPAPSPATRQPVKRVDPEV